MFNLQNKSLKLVSKSLVVAVVIFVAAVSVVVVAVVVVAVTDLLWHANTRIFLSIKVALTAYSDDRQVENFCFQLASFRILKYKLGFLPRLWGQSLMSSRKFGECLDPSPCHTYMTVLLNCVTSFMNAPYKFSNYVTLGRPM